MKKSLDPEQSALLAEWLTHSRANPAPITGTFPLDELMIARNAGLMGVTQADVERGSQRSSAACTIHPERVRRPRGATGARVLATD